MVVRGNRNARHNQPDPLESKIDALSAKVDQLAETLVGFLRSATVVAAPFPRGGGLPRDEPNGTGSDEFTPALESAEEVLTPSVPKNL